MKLSNQIKILALFGFTYLISCNEYRVSKFDKKMAIYTNDPVNFEVYLYFPMKRICLNKIYASETIGLVISNTGYDTIRVLSLCNWNSEVIEFLQNGIGANCSLYNLKDSSLLNKNIFVSEKSTFRKRKLKTYIADIARDKI